MLHITISYAVKDYNLSLEILRLVFSVIDIVSFKQDKWSCDSRTSYECSFHMKFMKQALVCFKNSIWNDNECMSL